MEQPSSAQRRPETTKIALTHKPIDIKGHQGPEKKVAPECDRPKGRVEYFDSWYADEVDRYIAADTQNRRGSSLHKDQFVFPILPSANGAAVPKRIVHAD